MDINKTRISEANGVVMNFFFRGALLSKELFIIAGYNIASFFATILIFIAEGIMIVLTGLFWLVVCLIMMGG